MNKIQKYNLVHTLTTSTGTQLKRTLTRDTHRRHLVTKIDNQVNNATPATLAYTHDNINRVTQRNYDTFQYNNRSEVTYAGLLSKQTYWIPPFPPQITSDDMYYYYYDDIGNRVFVHRDQQGFVTSINSPANALNQTTSIKTTFYEPPLQIANPQPLQTLTYDPDGNLLTYGPFSYTYDAENRLISVTSNAQMSNSPNVQITNHYDHQSRRVQKITPNAKHTFLYDGWNPVLETIKYANNTTDVIEYVWAKNSLVAKRINNVWYFPFYDHNNNITDYVNASGTVVAHYEYDVFGNTIVKTGSASRQALPRRPRRQILQRLPRSKRRHLRHLSG